MADRDPLRSEGTRLYRVLNDSGRAVLVQCDGMAELAEATASGTGANVATVHSDLTSFLTWLMQTGIIIDADDRQVHEGRQ